MHATAVRSTNQQPPDGERARDTAQNRVPWVARCELTRDVQLPGPSGSAPQTHGLRRGLWLITRTVTCRGRLLVTLRFLCRFLWWEQRENHPAKL